MGALRARLVIARIQQSCEAGRSPRFPAHRTWKLKMNAVNKCLRSLILVLAMAAPRAGVAEDAAAIIVGRLRQSCPIAAPGEEQAAYETCRAALFADERLHALFSPALRWGGDVPGKSL